MNRKQGSKHMCIRLDRHLRVFLSEGLQLTIFRIRIQRAVPVLFLILILTTIVLPARAVAQPQPGMTGAIFPASLMPPGLLVYLEAKDLRNMAARWDGAKEKADWPQSANFEQFKNSKIFLKMESRLEQFSRSAGFEITYERLSRYAGRRSALGLYNPSEVEFLFLTELTAVERQAADLVKLRGRFQARQAAERTYYLNQEGGRTVCYAETEPFFLIATQEDLLRSALTLLKNRGEGSLASDPDFREIAGTSEFNDFRMYLAMNALVRNTNFKREWIFGNLDRLEQYQSALVNVLWGATEAKEYRTFIFKQPASASAALPAVLMEKYVPNGYEYAVGSTADISIEQVALRISDALINPLPTTDKDISRTRPLYGSYQAYQKSRSRSIYEKQIDDPEVPEEPSPHDRGSFRNPMLQKALSEMGIRAAVEVGRTAYAEPGFFLQPQRAFVLHADPAKISRDTWRRLIESEYRELYTAGGLGASWKTRTLAGITYDIFASNTLQVASAQIGECLVLASPAEYMDRVIQIYQAALPPRFGIVERGDPLITFGTVDLKSARPNFTKLMNILDSKELRNRGEGSPPLFFSQNLSGLLATFARASRITFEQRRPSDKRLIEMVTYQWEP